MLRYLNAAVTSVDDTNNPSLLRPTAIHVFDV